MACYQLEFYELKLLISYTTVSELIMQVPLRRKSRVAYGVPYLVDALLIAWCDGQVL